MNTRCKQIAVLVLVLSVWVTTVMWETAQDMRIFGPKETLRLLVAANYVSLDFVLNDAFLLLGYLYYSILRMFVVLFSAAGVASLLCSCI
jgi:hypothetical protein